MLLASLIVVQYIHSPSHCKSTAEKDVHHNCLFLATVLMVPSMRVNTGTTEVSRETSNEMLEIAHLGLSSMTFLKKITAVRFARLNFHV